MKKILNKITVETFAGKIHPVHDGDVALMVWLKTYRGHRDKVYVTNHIWLQQNCLCLTKILKATKNLSSSFKQKTSVKLCRQNKDYVYSRSKQFNKTFKKFAIFSVFNFSYIFDKKRDWHRVVPWFNFLLIDLRDFSGSNFVNKCPN